jgi:rsbT co-antagonist protein RsbR
MNGNYFIKSREEKMPNSEMLYEFLMSKAPQITEEWYEGLPETVSGIYASTDPEEIRILKQQNYEFHPRFFRVFIQEETAFLKEMEGWITEIAQDENHLATPSNAILREFYRTRNQYLDLVKQFAALHECTKEEKELWDERIIRTMDKVTLWFLEEYDKNSMKRLRHQQEMIHELSSPVITITENTGLLPLVGDIDSARSTFILEKTLEQCNEKKLDYLYIDLSGVAIIDTMVARQLFHLHEALRLLGVKTILCGIRPEIAQTAIKLGLSFDEIPISSTLEKALHRHLNDRLRPV